MSHFRCVYVKINNQQSFALSAKEVNKSSSNAVLTSNHQGSKLSALVNSSSNDSFGNKANSVVGQINATAYSSTAINSVPTVPVAQGSSSHIVNSSEPAEELAIKDLNSSEPAEELAIKDLTTNSQNPNENSEQRKMAVAKRKSVPQTSSDPVQISVQAKKPKKNDVEGIIKEEDDSNIKVMEIEIVILLSTTGAIAAFLFFVCTMGAIAIVNPVLFKKIMRFLCFLCLQRFQFRTQQMDPDLEFAEAIE